MKLASEIICLKQILLENLMGTTKYEFLRKINKLKKLVVPNLLCS